MTEPILLSPDELVALTGKVRKSAQERVLLALGFRPRKRPDGTIVVLRSDINATPKVQQRTPALRLS